MKSVIEPFKLARPKVDGDVYFRLSRGGRSGGVGIVLFFISLVPLIFLSVADKSGEESSILGYLVFILILLSLSYFLLQYSDLIFTKDKLVLVRKMFPFQQIRRLDINEIEKVVYREYYNLESKVVFELSNGRSFSVKLCESGRTGVGRAYDIEENQSGIEINSNFSLAEQSKEYTNSILKVLNTLGIEIEVLK